MDKGLFITFEGIDGCGKSTQIKLLTAYLRDVGKPCLLVREPGGTGIGEKIRSILLDKENNEMSPAAELLLFEAARAQIVDEKIRPALEAGITVICDRFYDSTFAYQGVARSLGEDLVITLNDIATSGLAPDVTFLLDLSVEDAFARRKGRGEADDRMELLGSKFQEDVRNGYLKAASKFDRIKVIDASRSVDEIFGDIKAAIEERL
ncbi:MAG: dTMP kinase [Clostridiales bacterium]|nr:dTMP kinase [Clostridiales bacterium]MBR5358333.1 dTMP kinase [Clostridiales bacterium]